MAKQAAEREYLTLRRRYAAVIVRNRSLTMALQTAFEDIAYNSGLMKNYTLPALIKNTIANRNAAIDDLIGKLASPDYSCDDYDVSRAEHALLWHEARFLTVAEAAQLSTWPVHNDKSVVREEYKKFCRTYLKLNRLFIARFDAVTNSGWFIPRNPDEEGSIHACIKIVRSELEANIQQVKAELKKPKVAADKEELSRRAIRLRFTVQRFGERVLDELDITNERTPAKPVRKKNKTKNRCKYTAYRERYAACVVQYRQLAATLTDARAVETCYRIRHPAFYKQLRIHFANLNRHTDSLIMNLAETELSHESVEMMKHAFLLDEAIFSPIGQISRLVASRLYRSVDENPELNKAYCIEHLKLANLLSQRLALLCTSRHIVPATQGAENEVIKNIACTRTAIDAYISAAGIALSNPLYIVSRNQSENLWHDKLIHLIVQFIEHVVTKLAYTASPVSGASLWEQATRLASEPATQDMAVVQPIGHGNTVRVLH